MAQSWNDVFERQSLEAANNQQKLDICFIADHEKTIKPEPRKVMFGGGGNGFAMPAGIIRR